MAVAVALASRGRGRTAPNPNVGCVIVKDGRVLGRGWTQPGGRPHAEAMALDQAQAQAGEAARGATAYVTLEPCAHQSLRGPACADLLAEAGLAGVVAALRDPDPRTDGEGFARLRAHGLTVEVGVGAEEARRAMAGFLTRRALGRPHVTLKLGLSLDGKIALANGSSRWITGAPARAHAHLERARADAILVGRGTFAADAPRLDVRLRGLEERAPRRFVLASAKPQIEEAGWSWLPAPNLIGKLVGVDHLLIEGGAGVAASFLRDDLVDRLLLYRAPILVGGDGLPGIGDLGLEGLLEAHGRWALHDARMLGMDRLEVYERRRKG